MRKYTQNPGDGRGVSHCTNDRKPVGLMYKNIVQAFTKAASFQIQLVLLHTMYINIDL